MTLDLVPRGESGLDVLGEVRRRRAPMKVIVATESVGLVPDAIALGPHVVLLKPFDPSRLLDLLEADGPKPAAPPDPPPTLTAQ